VRQRLAQVCIRYDLVMQTTTRRRFLELAAGVAGAVACSSGVSPADIGDVNAGNVSALPVGTLRAVGSQPVCVGRDAAGVYAMTLTCTHQGCNMAVDGSVSARGVSCACHGSTFDPNGSVVHGPAPSALDHFAVSVDGSGLLTIHGGQQVDASTRLAV
jgi:Rieske Fe-S protein